MVKAHIPTQYWLDLLKREDRYKARHNTIPITTNTTPEHWWSVTQLARTLVDQGMKVIVEARFIAGGRADIFLPEIGVVLEVLHTETVECLKQKITTQYAGTPVKVIYVTTKELLESNPAEALELAFSRYK